MCVQTVLGFVWPSDEGFVFGALVGLEALLLAVLDFKRADQIVLVCHCAITLGLWLAGIGFGLVPSSRVTRTVAVLQLVTLLRFLLDAGRKAAVGRPRKPKSGAATPAEPPSAFE